MKCTRFVHNLKSVCSRDFAKGEKCFMLFMSIPEKWERGRENTILGAAMMVNYILQVPVSR